MASKGGGAALDHATIDDRIAWVLENPGMSVWLKSALKSALAQDPVTLSNDLEILTHLIRPRVNALTQWSVGDGDLPTLERQ